MTEKQKYEMIWKRMNYTSRTSLPYFKYLIEQFKGNKRILEIGTGTGILVQMLRQAGYKATGADITLEGLRYIHSITGKWFVECPAWEMPFKDNQFDISFSCDTLEHIPPDMVEKTITEIQRVTKKKTFHCIATFKENLYFGQKVHLSVHPIEYWKSLFTMDADIIDRSEILKFEK